MCVQSSGRQPAEEPVNAEEKEKIVFTINSYFIYCPFKTAVYFIHRKVAEAVSRFLS